MKENEPIENSDDHDSDYENNRIIENNDLKFRNNTNYRDNSNKFNKEIYGTT